MKFVNVNDYGAVGDGKTDDTAAIRAALRAAAGGVVHVPPGMYLIAGTIDMSSDATDPIMQFFAYEHLPPQYAEVSRPFCELAKQVVATLPRNAERTVALRKLLEAKDAAVRAAIAKP